MKNQNSIDDSGVLIAANGDVTRLMSVLTFLVDSAAHSITKKYLTDLPLGLVELLRRAVEQDGYNADVEFLGGVNVLHMVSGRVERDVVVAHLVAESVSGSSIDYVVDAHYLLGRMYRPVSPGMVFLDYEVRTGDPDQVFISGSSQYLGRWDLDRAIPLSGGSPGRGGHHWSIKIPLLPGQTIEFKFVRREMHWESGNNRSFTAGTQDVSDGDNFRY